MIDKMKRQTIVTLHQLGKSCRHISKLLSISRNTINKILGEGVDSQSPKRHHERDDLTPLIEAVYTRVNGNVVRVQEILKAEHNQDIAYSTLTRLVREIQLRKAPVRFGEYIYEPGIEMQHDTSPHKVSLGGKIIKAECASLIFGFSRKLFFQYYPRFTRFEAKAFLLAALKYMDGSCQRCIVDNTTVFLASGSGCDAIFAPDCVNFGKIFGFTFFAHAIRHSNRKGKIERPFDFIENNYLAGREFKDWTDLNQQSVDWCTTYANQKIKRALGKNPDTAFIQEKPYLQPLPEILPPVYQCCGRTVDTQGYVHLDNNRYSVPERFINKDVDVYKYIDEVVINFKHEEIARHAREINKTNQKIKAPGHHIQKNYQLSQHKANETEQVLLGHNEVLDAYIAEFKTRIRGRGLKSLNQLLYLKRTYPHDAFNAAIERAYTYGLYDLNRLEDLILKYIAGNVFNLSADKE